MDSSEKKSHDSQFVLRLSWGNNFDASDTSLMNYVYITDL